MSVREIELRLEGRGYASGTRTIQRDMVALSDVASVWHELGVQLEQSPGDTASAMRWSHAPGSKLRFLSAINRDQALMLSLVEQELRHFLPESAYSTLSAHLNGAGRVLDNPHNAAYGNFRARVRILPEGPARTLAQPVLNLLARINEALLQQVQVEVEYQSARSGKDNSYRLHPVGMVQQGLFHWLLAIKHRNDNVHLGTVQSFRLDRLHSVRLLRHEPVARDLPTLDQLQSAGKLELFAAGIIKLKLRFSPNEAGEQLCASFRDAPLGRGQRIRSHMDGSLELETEVPDSLELKWLLQRYADRIHVISPAHLRTHLKKFSLAAAALQCGNDTGTEPG